MTWDAIVVGGGMSGLAVAALIARQGARALVLERGDSVGGSSIYSAGLVWTAASWEALRQRCCDGGTTKQKALLDNFDDTVELLRQFEINVGPPLDGLSGFGRGHRIDIPTTLAAFTDMVEQAGGEVRLNVDHVHAHTTPNSGYAVEGRTTAGLVAEQAATLITATGGFQGSPQLLREYLATGAENLLLRSNRHSTGTGLKIGLSLGGGTTEHMTGFYGHLVPSPLNSFPARMFRPLTQYQSEYCLALNMLGQRFVDESQGDPLINQACFRQPGSRAVLVFDETIRRLMAGTPRFPGDQPVDRFAIAIQSGARVVAYSDASHLIEDLQNWGLPRQPTATTLADWCAVSASPGPLHAIQVQPTITFTYGGLRTDIYGRVLGREADIVQGLFAVGADAGGIYGPGYGGGLAHALVSAKLAAEAITGHTEANHGL